MRVLLIDDEPAVCDLLRRGLESESFAVDVAHCGEQGSYLARTNEYDVIVLDNMLPDKNGKCVCEEIRAAGKATPVIILSANAEVAQKIGHLNAGADDYMAKPFSFEELMARIRALLRRPASIEDEVLAAGEVTLDSKRNIVRRGEEEVYLTRKEFMLLEYLMRNRGAVLSRGMIMEHVWDMDMDPFSNTIECHVASLRRKMDAHELIETVPGRGYKIRF